MCPFQNVPVCTLRTCFNTCARGAGTHGDVLNVHTWVFSVPHHTAHTHTTTTTTQHSITHNVTRRQGHRERQREKTEKEDREKRERKKTEREEKTEEERQGKTKEKTRREQKRRAEKEKERGEKREERREKREERKREPRIWCEEAASTIQTLWRPELFGQRFVQLGEISAGRQALESARVAPGTLAKLRVLTSPERRPPVPREPIPPHLASAVPESPFDLDFDRFVSNIRSAKTGAAPGPSGLTSEHLHPILENDSSLTALFRVGVLFSRGHVPPGALDALRLGRITALAKPDGGIRGIVVGDVLRRIVAKTIAQQIGDQVEKSTAPFQFSLKTRAGSECVAHTLRTLSELNEATTILSVDGVGALVSRSALMQGLVDMPDGVKVLPFVRMFYGTPSQFLWEDELGTVNHIPQGEGGEQGDPLMPRKRPTLANPVLAILI